jgi:hypothetical protein
MSNEKAIKELTEKIQAVVTSKFGGDWYRAYTDYAARNGAAERVEREDLIVLLEDAKVGNGFTRGAWADGIMKELDKNKDGGISWEEFNTILKNTNG